MSLIRFFCFKGFCELARTGSWKKLIKNNVINKIKLVGIVTRYSTDAPDFR